MQNLWISIFLVILQLTNAYSQNTSKDSLDQNKETKKGFSFGAIPILAYDSDIGLKYGALVNLYHYGDGSRYPFYDHSLFVRWFQTTKGSVSNELKYDSERLIPNYRITTSLAYITEKALNFYGFNGYQTYYNPNFEQTDHPDYLSEVFYRHERKVTQFKVDFQRVLLKKGFNILFGFSLFDNKIGSVDLDKLNRGRSDKEKLPDIEGLYDLYSNWEVLSSEELKGGTNYFLKSGFVYNSCDNEADPNKGIWSEALLIYAPEAFGFERFTSTISLQHRHYISIIGSRLKFAYRLGYQTKITGKVPFYLLPYLIDSRNTFNAFGGSKTLRGVLRNRVVGNGSAYGNFEFRSKVFETVIAKQNFYIALNAFTDAAKVVDPYYLNLQNVPNEYLHWFNYEQENWHISYGAGIRLVLNQNFVAALDYGMALQKEDGTNGIYVGMDFLF